MRALLLTVLIGFFASTVHAAEINLEVLAQIESSGNPLAVSFAGAKHGRGLYQISEIALADYLLYHKDAKISSHDLFKIETNTQICLWLLKSRIPQLLRHYGHPVDTKHILWAYNAGIGRVNKGIYPKESQNYYKKYMKGINA